MEKTIIDPEGKTVKGTPIEIVEHFRDQVYSKVLLPEEARDNLDFYMEHLAQDLWRFYGIGLNLEGTTEEKADQLLKKLEENGLIEKVNGKEEK